MRKVVSVFFLLVCYSASAQISSGSIVVFNFTKDQIVVAADSLSVANGVPDYSSCKVAALSNQYIFASVGTTRISVSGFSIVSLVQPWDNIELARDAVNSSKLSVLSTEQVALQWANSVKSHWDSFAMSDRQRVSDIASANNGQFTSGVFIGKGLTAGAAIIEYDPLSLFGTQVKTGTFDTSGCMACGQSDGEKVCGGGKHLDVLQKFCSERKPNSVINVRTTLKMASESAKLAVKIVELTIDAYGESAKDVGGAVDSVSMTEGGKITWHSRKYNCPENQE